MNKHCDKCVWVDKSSGYYLCPFSACVKLKGWEKKSYKDDIDKYLNGEKK